MAKEIQQEENTVVDKKAEKRAAKMRKKEEKRKSKKGDLINGEYEEENEGGGSTIIVAVVTLIIVIVWIGILARMIKLDVGGFGSTVLHPVLKDVPVINKVLPKVQNKDVIDVQYPYATLDEAINRIKELEIELSEAIKEERVDNDTIAQLQAEISRLQQFEQQQAAFQQEKSDFYKEVVFSEKAPDINEYVEYYESIDAANAAELYKQVIQQTEQNTKIREYAQTYAFMKPKEAAAIMEEMTGDLKLVAEILEAMDAEARGDILGAMDSVIAAKVTKLMKPE